jgi:hypothetical protein
MSDLLKVLGEELYNQVLEKIGNQKIGFLDGYIPKTRFDEVNEKLKTSKEQIEKFSGQIEETKELLSKSEEYKTKFEELESKYNTSKLEYETNISNITKKSAIEKRLLEEGAKHTKLIMSDINMNNIKIDGENLIGLDDEIKRAKENYNDLFVQKQNVNNNNNNNAAGNNKNNDKNGHVDGENYWQDVEKKIFGE